MAKKCVLVEPRKLELQEDNLPTIKENEVKVKVLWASPKHGTEIADYRGDTPFIDNKFVDDLRLFLPRDANENRGLEYGKALVGNQWVGEIVEKGAKVSDYTIGEIVTTYGAIREYDIVNAVDNYRLRKLHKNISWKNAVCYDPAQYALSGVRDAKVLPGDVVAVIGLGAIGQLAVQMCHKIGAKVIAVDPIKHRREVALKYGATEVLDPIAQDVGLELKKITDSLGVDSVIETSGSPSALQAAFRGVAFGGTIAYVAFGKEIKGGLNFGQEAHFNYAKLIFSRASSEPLPDYPRWNRKRIEETCWQMLTNGTLNCEEIIDPVVSFSDIVREYDKYIDKDPSLSIKLGVKF